MRNLMACLVVFLVSGAILAQAPKTKTLKVEKKWEIVVPKAAADKVKSKTFVATANAWKKWWKELQGKKELPKVDFKKSMLLLSFKDAADPNRGSMTIRLNDKGHLEVLSLSTLIGFRPSDMTKITISQIPREGVKAVKRYDPKARKMVTDPVPDGKDPSKG